MSMDSVTSPVRKLSEVLRGLVQVQPGSDAVISNLVLDSRQVTQGSLFVACKGHRVDGRDYIAQAVELGAAAVLAEKADPPLGSLANGIPLVEVAGLNHLLGSLAANFFGQPSQQLQVVAVTGTNGKTTSVQLLQQCHALLGEHSASIGTMGYGSDLNALKETGLTTPDAISLQRIYAELLAEGVSHVAMEISSHAIEQNRHGSTRLKGALFTNLSHDHLDYHLTVEAYAAAKARLFTTESLAYAVINVSDPVGANEIYSAAGQVPRLVVYGLEADTAQFAGRCEFVSVASVELSENGVYIGLKTSWGEAHVRSALLGRFNVDNLLGVIACLLAEGVPFEKVLSVVPKLKPVKGRMQTVDVLKKIGVCVDYAHTPDGLRQALLASRPHTRNRLWVVFGCGGDRDRAKRPVMGAIAAELADVVVVTSDNPRTEDPDQIISDIIEGVSSAGELMVEVDREKAIAAAIAGAVENDFILLAGKGHEDYQIVGHEKIWLDDAVLADKYLQMRKVEEASA